MFKKFSFRFLISGLLVACTYWAGAVNDTLTFRQVYNFNVGDTFDYADETINSDMYLDYTQYVRKVLVQKTYSSQLDTLFLKYTLSPAGSFEFDTITNLDSVAIFNDTAGTGMCQNLFSFFDTSLYGKLSNTLQINCFEAGSNYAYTMGLGRTSYGTQEIALSGFGCICYSEQLIYYANADTAMGTPYYVANGSSGIHYLPLPEECAVWTENLYTSTNYMPPFKLITEQLKTGNKIIEHGITYVELICSIENGLTNTFSPDSLIGYFYNDTNARMAYFTQSVDSPVISRVIANFNILNGYSCGAGGHIEIGSIFIGGNYRTAWYCVGNTGGLAVCAPEIIAGIGSVAGLMPINIGGPVCQSLACFSVCGQTLYPNDTAASCPLLTGVEQISEWENIKLLPNPTHDYCTLQNSGYENLSASVCDITGREVLPLFVNQQVRGFNFSTAGLSSGVYLVQITDNYGRVKVVKLVKQ